jgi:hypothetical protein
MKRNTKSSITLPPNELKMVEGLMKKLGAKSKVEVIRRGLQELKNQTDRAALKQSYAEASLRVRKALRSELDELDHLAGEGVE